MFNQKKFGMISPLPLIVVQNRSQKVNLRITQMIKKLGKRRERQIIQQRSQGFWMQDQVKQTLDRIKLRSCKIKTLPSNIDYDRQENKSNLKRHLTFDKNNIQKIKKISNKFYLPELKQMVEERQRQNNYLIVAKRRKIIHLLILGENRRSLKRLYQALDIVLLASFYFQRDDEERVLKSICLKFISKLHKQIKKQNTSLNRKSKLNKKRKSLTVMNYFSRQNFMQNFMMKLRRTKLVGQFSYSDSLRQKNNKKKINAKCDVVIPKPEQIFNTQQEDVKNYDYVAVTVDDYTNMLPYEYPKSLSQKISPNQYKQMICKLNGLLFPESKCYSFSSIIKLFYIPFMTIFMIMLSFSILRSFITDEIGRIIIMASTLTAVLTISIKVSREQSGYTNYIQIKDKMKAYLEEWEQSYSKSNIKFRMGQNADAIFIVFPSQMPDQSALSSSLTKIQQVEQNYTDNFTDSKHFNNDQKTKQNIQKFWKRSCRRTGSRFQQNGNLMKKRNYSKFSKYQKSYKRMLTINKSHNNQCFKDLIINDRTVSQKKIEIPLVNNQNFLFDQIHEIKSQKDQICRNQSAELTVMNESKVKSQNKKNNQEQVYNGTGIPALKKINSINLQLCIQKLESLQKTIPKRNINRQAAKFNRNINKISKTQDIGTEYKNIPKKDVKQIEGSDFNLKFFKNHFQDSPDVLIAAKEETDLQNIDTQQNQNYRK